MPINSSALAKWTEIGQNRVPIFRVGKIAFCIVKEIGCRDFPASNVT
jgi:hypothetical protein